MNSVANILLACGLLAPWASAQSGAVDAGGGPAQSRVVKLNGGLEAEILGLGRSKDHRLLTMHVRTRNLGKNTAELLLISTPIVATDNTGGAWALRGGDPVSGIAVCRNGQIAAPVCLGIPEKRNDCDFVPLQGFTQLDPNPGAGITVNLRLSGEGDGPLVSFSANLFFRLIADPVKNATLSDEAQYRQFRMMSLSFPSMPVTDAK